jgi:hypothetical protein
MTPEGAARTFSKLAFVAGDCSKIMVVNKDLVEQYIGASTRIGQQMVGQKQFKTITMKEMKRREKEVRATGLDAWCNYQKSDLNTQGLKAFSD